VNVPRPAARPSSLGRLPGGARLARAPQRGPSKLPEEA
jgi:hypothetical protein